MSDIFQFDPDAGKFPYLDRGGKYGPAGLAEIVAEVEVSDFTPFIEQGSEREGPGWDRNCDRGAYCKFTFKVKPEGGEVCYVDAWQPLWKNSRSRAGLWLDALNIPKDGSGNYQVTSLVGTKCMLELGPPYVPADPDKAPRSGNVVAVYGIPG